MELIISSTDWASNAVTVKTVHESQGNRYSIDWNTIPQVFEDSQKKGFDVFQHINQYWSTLPLETQDKIFDVYRRIKDTFDLIHNHEQLTMSLRPLIAELFFLHPQENIRYWVDLKSDILVPSIIKPEFDATKGMIGTIQRTYVIEDYRNLIPLAITMRLMIPVWGEFIYRSRRELGTIYKEYQAFQLLSASPVMNCVAMERLRVFVENTIPKDHSLDAAIISGISREDFPTWILALTVVRRLCYGDIRGIEQNNSSLISYLFMFIEQKVTTLDSQIGTITEKRTSESSDGENNLSRLEGFKIKQAVATGDIAIVSYYIQDAITDVLSWNPNSGIPFQNHFINRLCPDQDFPSMVKEAYASTSVLFTKKISHPQVMIAGWTLSKFIPIRSIPYLQKSDIIAMLAIAVAFLWKLDRKELSALVSAFVPDNHYNESHIINQTRSRISRAAAEDLQKTFPYQRRTNSRAKNAKLLNPVIDTIDVATEELTSRFWISNLPFQWTDEQGIKNSSTLSIPVDIREKLADLIKHVETMEIGSPLITQPISI